MSELNYQRYENSRCRFVGAIIGESDTHTNRKDRWVEIFIFRTKGGKYIVEVLGKSRVPGEETRETVHVCRDARAVINCMKRRGQLSRPAEDAIRDASGKDRHILRAWSEFSAKQDVD